MLIFFMIMFGCTYFFRISLYDWLAFPLLRLLPEAELYAINVTSGFFIPLKIALFSALIASIPFILYQLWSFIVPALYQLERKYLNRFLIASVLLFYFGFFLGYLLFLPIIFEFFYALLPENTDLIADIAVYFQFVMKMLLLWAIVFEIPIVMLLLIYLNVVSRESFIRKRRWFIVGSFIGAMVVTPPDVISQCLLALPMIVLFELGLFCSGRFMNKKSKNFSAKTQ